MVSSFFQKANIASLGALLVYLILYVPYGFVFTRGGKISVIGSLAVVSLFWTEMTLCPPPSLFPLITFQVVSSPYHFKLFIKFV